MLCSLVKDELSCEVWAIRLERYTRDILVLPINYSSLIVYTSITPSLNILYNTKSLKVQYIYKFYHNA